jgi:hypothetical protein
MNPLQEEIGSRQYATATTEVYMRIHGNATKAVKLRAVSNEESLAWQIRHVNVQAALGLPGLCVEKAEADRQSAGLRIKVIMRPISVPLGQYLEEQKVFEEGKVRKLVLEVAEILAIAEEYVWAI